MKIFTLFLFLVTSSSYHLFGASASKKEIVSLAELKRQAEAVTYLLNNQGTENLRKPLPNGIESRDCPMVERYFEEVLEGKSCTVAYNDVYNWLSNQYVIRTLSRKKNKRELLPDNGQPGQHANQIVWTADQDGNLRADV